MTDASTAGNGMQQGSRIFIAGHRGLVGSAICRHLSAAGYERLLLRTSSELDLTERDAVWEFFKDQRPEYVVLAAAKAGEFRPTANIRWSLSATIF